MYKIYFINKIVHSGRLLKYFKTYIIKLLVNNNYYYYEIKLKCYRNT